MAGFGKLSLTQTAIGTLLDQRAIVLYKQPEILSDNWVQRNIANELWGSTLKYEELFSGMLDMLGEFSQKIGSVAGVNPYGISYMDAKVNIESEICEHPVENGSLIADAAIILPVTAEVTVAMPTYFAQRIYKQMKDLFESKKEKIILQTKYGLYTNLVLQNIVYELEHDTIDRAKFILTLRQIQEVESYGIFKQEMVASAEKIKNPSDAPTVNIGSQVGV